MRHIIPISGKDSLATALVQKAKAPELDYEYVFNPTGAEFPEVFDWIKMVEAYLDKSITIVGDDLFEIIQDFNYFLPSRQARYCTRKAKIEPFEKWIGKTDCIVYYGIRADEKRTGYISVSGRIMPAYPLVEAGVGIIDVYRIISAAGLKPPTFFWQSVYDAVVKILGGGIISLLPEWQIDILFAGRTRANCYFCFNQRLYEWVWLLETHSDLFWKAEAMEHMGGDKDYHWGSESLASIAARADKIKRKRIAAIVKSIRRITQGRLLFPEDEAGFIDTLKTTSCGLFCGK